MNDVARPRVLVSAYACEPERGSEPEVGLQVMLAAVEDHDVWVLTRQNNMAALQEFVTREGLGDRITLVGLDLGPGWLWMKRRFGSPGLYAYYSRWQNRASKVVARLHAEVGFDLVHHATFAVYWQPTVGPAVDAPFVWGPVGGGVQTPVGLLGVLGWRGVLRDAVRMVMQRISERRPAVRATMRRATLTLVQNPETAGRLVGSGAVATVPNGLAASVPGVPEGERSSEILVVGRQVPYKAGTLAVRTLAAMRNRSVRLVFVGDGPERARVERTAQRLGVADRVEFAGRLPRQETILRVGRAALLLHPALHEDASLTVCEALAVGTPVVALDVGGPPVLLSRWPQVPSTAVPVGTLGDTVRALAEAADRFVSEPVPMVRQIQRPTVEFAVSLRDAYRTALAGSGDSTD